MHAQKLELKFRYYARGCGRYSGCGRESVFRFSEVVQLRVTFVAIANASHFETPTCGLTLVIWYHYISTPHPTADVT